MSVLQLKKGFELSEEPFAWLPSSRRLSVSGVADIAALPTYARLSLFLTATVLVTDILAAAPLAHVCAYRLTITT